MFNSYFCSAFTSHFERQSINTNASDTISFGSPAQTVKQINSKEHEVRLTLRSLNQDKAFGPDEIPGRILKATAEEIAPLLTCLFNIKKEKRIVWTTTDQFLVYIWYQNYWNVVY